MPSYIFKKPQVNSFSRLPVKWEDIQKKYDDRANQEKNTIGIAEVSVVQKPINK